MSRPNKLERQLHSPSAWGETVARFLVFFVPVMCILVIGVVWLYRAGLAEESERIRDAERAQVNEQRLALAEELDGVISDLLILRSNPSVRLMVNQGSPQAVNLAADEFETLLLEKALYDHATYFDNTGREVLRVNYKEGTTTRIEQQELQEQDYVSRHVRRALELGPEEVYVSEFDLNKEHGEIERPFKPTIRFAVPAFDDAGNRQGLLMLYYQGRRLISILVNSGRDINSPGEGRVMLVNHVGYWLYAGVARPNDEWGWLREGYEQETLASKMPVVWRLINDSLSDRIEDERGLLTFDTVYPLHERGQRRIPLTNLTGGEEQQETPRSRVRVVGRNMYWKIISFVPRELLVERAADLRARLTRWGALLTVAAGFGCWFLAKYRTDIRRADGVLRDSERLAAIGEAMTGLAHESRNALQRSQACLEMLAKRVADRPEATELIGRIQHAQTDLHYLYETVRGYAAPLRLEREPIDLRKLALDTWAELTDHIAPDQKPALEIDPPGIDTVCRADTFALKQATRNILENALNEGTDPTNSPTNKAAPFTVAVRFWPDTLNTQPALTMSIKDNGRGLTHEQAARMFDAFYTTRVRGTGLGLAITRRIIDAHGGRVAVGADSESGANILITIPRDPA